MGTFLILCLNNQLQLCQLKLIKAGWNSVIPKPVSGSEYDVLGLYGWNQFTRIEKFGCWVQNSEWRDKNTWQRALKWKCICEIPNSCIIEKKSMGRLWLSYNSLFWWFFELETPEFLTQQPRRRPILGHWVKWWWAVSSLMWLSVMWMSAGKSNTIACGKLIQKSR